MAEFTFYGWTAADLGMTSIFDLFGGGPFTVAGTPEPVTISDGAGDLTFDDAPSQPTPDPGADQVAFGDIVLDGVVVVPDGANVWNIGEFTITNATTGETGTLIVLGDSANGPVGMASTLLVNVGDVISFSNFEVNGSEPYAPLICFAAGTGIDTARGQIGVEDLAIGDAVTTLSNGDQEIRWIGTREVSAWELARDPKLRPVRITAGALGSGLPTADMWVSRQHRILVRSKVAERMFGEREVLVSAINLTVLPGVFVDTEIKEVRYHHLLFDAHEIVFANNTPAESLFTGPEALKAIDPDALEEVLKVFPEISARHEPPNAVRRIPPVHRQKKLVARHLKNDLAVINAS